MFVFRAQEESNMVLILHPALGVKASFYFTLASELARQKYHVVVGEYRGMDLRILLNFNSGLGSSNIRAGKGKHGDWGYLRRQKINYSI
ncbi:MAG: hypothetical protein JST59_02275 [Actinobacteria bacterium]|nr:hypothetical protein [Actinomycetota bacterium]